MNFCRSYPHDYLGNTVDRKFNPTQTSGTDEQRTTNDEQRTTNNEQRATNNEQRTTNNPNMTNTEFKTGVIYPVECVKEGFELIKKDYWLLFAILLVGAL